MKANKDGFIILKNLDETNQKINEESKMVLRQNSMHRVIPWFLLAIGLASLITCFIP